SRQGKKGVRCQSTQSSSHPHDSSERGQKPLVSLPRRLQPRRHAISIFDIRRSTATYEPRQQGGLEFLLDSVVQGRLSLRVLVVYIRTSGRKVLGRVELLPTPAGEKWRNSHDGIDPGARIDQQLQILDVVPPAGRKQPTPGCGCGLCAAFDQQLDQGWISASGHRKEEGRAGVTADWGFDVQSSIEQEIHESSRYALGHMQIRAGCRASQMQQIAALPVSNRE